jgi:hypothetical protein
VTCFDSNYSWQPIETAPDSERVMVCGWSRQTPTCAGYWWYEEAFDGSPTEKLNALYWAPLVIPPFPAKADAHPSGQRQLAGSVHGQRGDGEAGIRPNSIAQTPSEGIHP